MLSQVPLSKAITAIEIFEITKNLKTIGVKI